MPKKLCVLMLDESEVVSSSVIRRLEQGGFEVLCRRAGGMPQWQAALANAHWDLALCNSPSTSDQCVAAVRCAHQAHPNLPVVVLNHGFQEDEMLAALKAGACDWIEPDDLTRLVPIVRRELRESRTAREPVADNPGAILAPEAACFAQHQQFEESLRPGAELFRELSECSPFGILLLNECGHCRYSNPRAQTILGVTAEGGLQHGWLRGLAKEDREATLADWLRTVSENAEATCELRLERNQRLAWIRLRARALTPGTRGRPAFVVAVDDITEKKQFDTEFLQARKMETVGRLAGGVAHDFNNLLAAINSFARLAQDNLPEDNPARNDIAMILKAAEKATDLTRRLLAFARREVAVPQILNPHALLIDLGRTLRRLIREDIELVVHAGADTWPIQIDPNQFEQVLVNLVVNAREAMARGGTLRIETANTELRKTATLPDSEVKEGDYVLLTVHDTGVGMTEEVRTRIFEPFFSTKQQGKGTGLGLATVYGIVKQNRGHIEVLSQPSQGTTVNIYFPRAGDSGKTPRPEDPLAAGDLTGTETVFVVEDEPDVRRLTERILKSKGYRVVTAGDGEEALRYAEQNPALRIHLLLTDMVMPTIGGRVLAERLRCLRPGLKVLYMSGYTEELFDIQKSVEPSSDFIHKPFTPQSLQEQVRALLDEKV